MQRKYLKYITYRDEYVFIRNKVNPLINELRLSFFRQRIYKNQRETKNLWSILKEVTNVCPKSETIKEIYVKKLMIQIALRSRMSLTSIFQPRRQIG